MKILFTNKIDRREHDSTQPNPNKLYFVSLTLKPFISQHPLLAALFHRCHYLMSHQAFPIPHLAHRCFAPPLPSFRRRHIFFTLAPNLRSKFGISVLYYLTNNIHSSRPTTWPKNIPIDRGTPNLKKHHHPPCPSIVCAFFLKFFQRPLIPIPEPQKYLIPVRPTGSFLLENLRFAYSKSVACDGGIHFFFWFAWIFFS